MSYNEYRPLTKNDRIDNTLFDDTSVNFDHNSKNSYNQNYSKEGKFWFIKIYLFQNIFLILGAVFYILSLEGCFMSFMSCLHKITTEKIHHRILRNLGVSSIFFSFQLMLLKYCYISSKINNILFAITIFFLTFIYDTGTDLRFHGGYNRLALFVGMFVIIFAIYLLIAISRIFSENYKNGVITLSILIGLVIVSTIIIKDRMKKSCIGWDIGFKGVTIDNDKFCKIKTPDVCYQNLFNNYLDLSSYLHEDCKTIGNNSRDILSPYLQWFTNPYTTLIGYPRNENYDYLDKAHDLNFQHNILNELIDMNDPNISKKVKDQVEVTISFPNESKVGIAKIDLKKQTVKANVRRDYFNEVFKKQVLTPNVFILFIDSVSRPHFIRKLPKTWKWIEQYYKSSDSTPYEAFQFMKYHGTGTWTNINMIPGMFGIDLYSGDDATYFNKFYKNAGYMTGSVISMCSRELINLDNSMSNFDWCTYDHEFSAFFCDPNFTPFGNPFPILNGPYAIRKKCLYGKSNAEWTFDYARQFLNAYKDYPKLFRVDITDSHEGTGEVIKYDDEVIYDFLVDFEQKGHMKNNIMIIVTDHNYNMPGPYSIFDLEDWKQELTLPHLNFILSKDMKDFKKIKENLSYNENIFTNPYDLHATILNILNPKEIKTTYGESLFYNKLSLNPSKRSCEQMKIKKDWCRCSEEYSK